MTANSPTQRSRSLSATQEGVWLFERSHPGTSSQNVAAAMEVTPRVDDGLLGQAVQEVLASRERLRWGLHTRSGQPQAVETAAPFELGVKEAKDPQETRERLQEAADEPFDLADPPLVRCSLIRGEPDRCLLVLVGHRLALTSREPAELLVGIHRAYNQLPDLEGEGGRQGVSGREPAAAQASSHTQQRAFWEAELAGEPPVVALPASQSRTTGRTYRDGVVSAQGPSALNRALTEDLQGDADGNPEAFLLAAFSVLIARYTRQDELVLGWSVERPQGDAGDGRWENWLPVLAEMAMDATFRSHARRTGEKAAEVFAHGDIPFTQLVRELGIHRSAAHPPLIQVLLELRQQPAAPGPAPFAVLPRSTPLDLHLVADQGEHACTFHLAYNADLLEAEAAEQLLTNFLHLAQSAIEAPDQKLGQLPLLTPAQHRRVVQEFNRTDADYPSDRCLHELVAEQAAHTPEACAYIFEGRKASYREVEGWANAIARDLRSRGIGPGDLVPLLMDRSLALPVAMLGIMKAGAAFVPMDVHWPAERIEQITTDVAEQPLVLLGPGAETAPPLPQQAEALPLSLDQLDPTEPPEDAGVTSDDPIFVIYTSGSTGKPKGAINRHRGIVNRLTYMNRRYGCGPSDVILQTSAHIFDASVWQYFWPLINGRPSVLPAPMVGFDYPYITELIERHAVTVTDFVPSVFNLLVDFLETDEAMRRRLATLRQVLIGGEALSPAPSFRFQ
ncbi:AMP-binding protein, partial [Thiohalorhabdus sp.]|uniref:AMP-binding protein n=1 Tax=Thiohalorhabdus sp. TaxID=3094134 RepID=UPI002FC27F53